MVSGKESLGQVPLTVNDTLLSVAQSLGDQTVIDGRSNFAAAVNSQLILGHRIVVADKTGATSRQCCSRQANETRQYD
jgi:hypothetical protein